MQSHEHISVGVLARQVGTTVRTVRYYEQVGLLAPASRSDGGHRRYGPEQQARVVLKDAAYTVLGEMISAMDTQPPGSAGGAGSRLSAQIGALLDMQIELLHARMDPAVQEAAASLPAEHAGTLYQVYERWESAAGWRLINAADPCGT